ncbi:MAG: DUF6049 family protein [Nocardioidaceae bacterium]
MGIRLIPSPRVAGLLVALLMAVGGAPYAVAAADAGATSPAAATGFDSPDLEVTIHSVQPLTLTRGKPLRITGHVTNDGIDTWTAAQVYLVMSPVPATTPSQLAAMSTIAQYEATESRVYAYGLFDQIGDLPPGATTPYHVSVPYGDLPMSGAVGVYHIGVIVLATAPDGTRTADPLTRSDTTVPLLPKTTAHLNDVGVVTLLPITSPIHRGPDGAFLDDDLAAKLEPGGRLWNLLDYALQMPTATLQVAIDPALLSAVQEMSRGYLVRSIGQIESGAPGSQGAGRAAATAWLSDLDKLIPTQNVVLLPWGNPDVNSLARSRMTGVIQAAIEASRHYATAHHLTTPVAVWQQDGNTTRRAIMLSKRAGATMQIVSQRCLTKLAPPSGEEFTPSLVKVPTKAGEIAVVAASSRLGGQRLTPDTTPLELRQNALAEATVRALAKPGPASPAVAGLPFAWNPGPPTEAIASAFAFPTLIGDTLVGALAGHRVAYNGPIKLRGNTPPLSPSLIESIVTLRNQGETFAGMLTQPTMVRDRLHRDLAAASSVAWKWQPDLGVSVTGLEARAVTAEINKVTVTGPPFVAMSSDSGSFPLTVTNGLTRSVTVQVRVIPENPALRIPPLSNVTVVPGQHRDLEVTSVASGSGLTAVRARLTTPSGRAFGVPWKFEVRATQIGLIIWIVMGVGALILFGTAGYRITKRIWSARHAPAGGDPS